MFLALVHMRPYIYKVLSFSMRRKEKNKYMRCGGKYKSNVAHKFSK